MPSRRRALCGFASLTAAFAGCNGLTDGSSPGTDAVSNEFERPENVAMDPPTTVLRRSGSRGDLVDVRSTDSDQNSTESVHRRAVERGFVTTSDAASLLDIDDGDGADTARRFLDETDFSSAFVFVDRGNVRQCFERRLCYVAWTASELRRTYARVFRDYDVACSTDERDDVARFVRLDGTVDPGQITPGQTAIHTAACPVPDWRRDDRGAGGTETTAPNARPAEGR